MIGQICRWCGYRIKAGDIHGMIDQVGDKAPTAICKVQVLVQYPSKLWHIENFPLQSNQG